MYVILPLLCSRVVVLLWGIHSCNVRGKISPYKGINRAIPDAQFEDFVDTFARRVAGWDHYAIAAAKKLINERTGFPTANQQLEAFNSFLADVSQGAVPARLKAMAAAGLQTDLNFEINFSEEELKFVGDGPWDV
jgi:hypothetical protein